MKRRLLIAFFVFPLAWGAMAVNVFFISLIGSWIGGSVMGVTPSILLGALVTIPTSWYFACHIDKLMRIADGES